MYILFCLVRLFTLIDVRMSGDPENFNNNSNYNLNFEIVLMEIMYIILNMGINI
jgi:hypothetical protein